MAVAAEEKPVVPVPQVIQTLVADPAPLGLAGFALTTFLISLTNAHLAPSDLWVGPALFYGGLAQLLAGMWEFRNRNVFGATAFSTYGGFWMSLFIFVILISTGAVKLSATAVDESLAWFLLAFFIFNTYMMFWSSMINWAVFGVFLTLEITEGLLWVGFFAASARLRVRPGVGGSGRELPCRSRDRPRRNAVLRSEPRHAWTRTPTASGIG